MKKARHPFAHRFVPLAALATAAGLLIQGSLEAVRPLPERVVIRRDTFGVPHILADDEEAAGFGLGYAQAEDHGVELVTRLVRSRGEISRHLGPEHLASDLAMRRLDNAGEARRALPGLGKGFRRALAGFAAGVNLYVREHRDRLPAWIPEFTAADILANTRNAAVEAIDSPARLRALTAKYPSRSGGAGVGPDPWDPEGLYPGDEPGSNALAINGRRSASGRAILLGNPHLSWSSRYWEAHVTIPGRLDFYGSTLVGFPWLRAGFNAHLGYVQTNNAPDLEDVFAVPLDPVRPDRYVFDRQSRSITRSSVAVPVLQPDGTTKTESREYESTHLGPVIHRTDDRVFVWRSVSLGSWRYFEGFFELSFTRNLREFQKVLGRQYIPTSNFTYADADGNILYQWNARLPKRIDDGTSYALDVPGDTKKYVWSRLHPLRGLPHLLNPPGGYIQNANNPPWFVSLTDPLDPQRFPPYVERGELALRPQLALRMLDAKASFTVDEVRALKFSTRLLLADRVKPALLDAARAVATPSADLAAGIALLDAWDSTASAESVGGVVFQRAWDQYSAAVKQPFAQAWDPARPADTPSGLGDPGQAVRALEEAVRWARGTYGTERVAWGEVHRFRFGDLDLPADGASGQYGAYKVQRFDPAADGKRMAGWGDEAKGQDLVGFGDAWVLLVHFTRPVQAMSVLAYGQARDRQSPHSRDQIRLFAAHELRPVWFSEADVAAHTERVYRPGQTR